MGFCAGGEDWLIGWVLLGGKFRCGGWSGVIARGRGPLLRLQGGCKPSLGDRGTPTHPPGRSGAGARAPAFGRRGEDGAAAPAEARRGPRGQLCVARRHRPRFGLGASRLGLRGELPGTAARSHPEVLGSSSFCFFGVGC